MNRNLFPFVIIHYPNPKTKSGNHNESQSISANHNPLLRQALTACNLSKVKEILSDDNFYINDKRFKKYPSPIFGYPHNDSALIMRSAVAGGCPEIIEIIMNDDRIHHCALNGIAHLDAIEKGQPKMLLPKVMTLKLLTLLGPMTDQYVLDPLSSEVVVNPKFLEIYNLSVEELAHQLNEERVPVIPRAGKYLALLILTYKLTSDQRSKPFFIAT